MFLKAILLWSGAYDFYNMLDYFGDQQLATI
jgi:hypothetical protein